MLKRFEDLKMFSKILNKTTHTKYSCFFLYSSEKFFFSINRLDIFQVNGFSKFAEQLFFC